MIVIGFLSQKGGSGKSTLARLFGAEYVADTASPVYIADMDTKQATSSEWAASRREAELGDIPCGVHASVGEAIRAAADAQILIFDGAPHASEQTLEIAQACDLVVIPSGPALDDLKPAVRLAHELANSGLDEGTIRFCLFRVDADAQAETREACNYLQGAGYEVIRGALEDKPSYRRALDAGRSPAETVAVRHGRPYERLNRAAAEMADDMARQLLDRAMMRLKPDKKED